MTETPSVVIYEEITDTLSNKMQGNQVYMPTYKNIDEFHAGNINSKSNLAYGAVKLQGNEADTHICHSVDESHISNINT